MTLAERIKYYYIDENKNCAISTLLAASDLYDLGLTYEDAKLIAGFGGGIGCGSTCGCLAGAVAVLGKLYADSEPIKEVSAAFAAVFKDKLGVDSWDCAHLSARYKAEEVRCLACVQLAADVLEAFIAEKNAC